jgi:parvulin-like peptidyl-prolyl isomerase
MVRFCLPFSSHTRHLLLCMGLLGTWGAMTPLLAQKHSSKSSPSPSPSPRALTPDSIGAVSPSPADVLPDPVAKVNGQPISRADLERVTAAVVSSSGRRLEALSDADRKAAYRSVLDQIINDRLLSARAKSEEVDEVTVLRTYDNLQKQYPDAAAFEAQIKRSGQTPEKVRENIRHQLAQQQWLEKQIADDTKVSPQEVEKFYKDGPPSQFDVPEMVSASHILVAVRRDAPPEDALAAENKINAVADRLKKGEKFETLAAQNSDDPNTKDKGGDLGFFMKDRVLPEIGDAAFKLKVGEVGPPVRSEFGYHLIKLTGRHPAHTATFDEVKAQIQTYLAQQRRSAAAARVVQSLRDKAKVEIYLS